ncbi:MAG: AAA family ATPase [Oscillospiraceae bacterium]|jgi:septum site-determining protein MinD|nr:AAA family ATPase [Oscillospiraceae bacterium]
MGKIITVASGKGGTGKTTSVAALSSCLAVLGHKTLCIDFDTGLGNLDLALGMSDFTVMNYMDVLTGHLDIAEAASESPVISKLFYLSAPMTEVSEDIPLDTYAKMFDSIRKDFDYCLIDSPPGIGKGFKAAHHSADMSITVTLGELPAMRDATRAAGALRESGVTNLRLLVNRVKASCFKQTRTTIDDVIDTTGIRLLGIIAEDKYVFRALHENKPLILYKKRKSAHDFLDAARRITGEDVPQKLY